MKYKKISIVTPSYNQANFLEKCILSIINQNYPNLEFIVIDGGSTDGSIEIIKKYEKYLKYWISEKDNGQSDAINKGLKVSTGDIFNWINSDDLLLPDSLHRINEVFNKCEPDIVVGNTQINYFHNNKIQRVKSIKKDFIYQIPSRMPFPQPSVFYSFELLNENRYVNPFLHYAMDMDLLIRATFSKLDTKFVFLDNYLSQYTIHPHSKTYSLPLKFFEEWRDVFIQFCKGMNFQFSLRIIEDMGWSLKSQSQVCYFFSDSIIKKFYIYEKIFLAYFLKYQMFYFLEKKDLGTINNILKIFKKYLDSYYYKWWMWKYTIYLNLPKFIKR